MGSRVLMWFWATCQEQGIKEKGGREVKGGRHKNRAWAKGRNKIETGRWGERKIWHERKKKLDKWKWMTQESKGSKEWEKWEKGTQEERRGTYFTRTLDSSHLFEHSAQPFSLLMLVPRLAFAPRGLRGKKHNVALACPTTTPPRPPWLKKKKWWWKCVFHLWCSHCARITKWFHGEAVTQGMFMTTVKLMFSLKCWLVPNPSQDQNNRWHGCQGEERREVQGTVVCMEESQWSELHVFSHVLTHRGRTEMTETQPLLSVKVRRRWDTARVL